MNNVALFILLLLALLPAATATQYDFNITLQPHATSVQLGDAAIYTLSIRNTGTNQDTFTPSVQPNPPESYWASFMPPNVTLAGNATAAVSVVMGAKMVGAYSMVVRVASTNGAATKNESFSMVVTQPFTNIVPDVTAPWIAVLVFLSAALLYSMPVRKEMKF